ncbi:hypothetical protein Scep_012833 [Stephania cephalantha]|uniref:Stigma-specific STIG1-like protein 1 n=1 Tax=Stephania cephalantha TaxID=152367 RepID=A0AAP0JHW8_9MAGN
MAKMIIGIAIGMTIATALVIATTTNRGEHNNNYNLPAVNISEESKEMSKDVSLTLEKSERVSRFLAEEKNPRASPRAKYHCHKDNSVCYEEGSPGTTCCNNKCIDVKTDRDNCGGCKNKCKYTYDCCDGQCVNLAYDKRHCGQCFHKCLNGDFCLYGMCDYA